MWDEKDKRHRHLVGKPSLFPEAQPERDGERRQNLKPAWSSEVQRKAASSV